MLEDDIVQIPFFTVLQPPVFFYCVSTDFESVYAPIAKTILRIVASSSYMFARIPRVFVFMVVGLA